MVTSILAIITAVMAGLAAVFGLKSDKSKSEANLARINDHLAHASEQAGLRAEKAVSEVEKRQQDEKKEIDKAINDGRRDYFEGADE